jgi:putative heme iron utilization protein
MDTQDAQALQALIDSQPVAALATLHNGDPAVSMTPFARVPGSTRFVIHVSALATHTRDMLQHPAVSLLITAPLHDADSPLALPRASVQGTAQRCEPGSPGYDEARAAYLAKLPDSEELFSFGDFSLFVIEARALRYVAGFGRAMSVVGEQLTVALAAGDDTSRPRPA